MTMQSIIAVEADALVADAGVAREAPAKVSDIRIPALDGLRGLMTLFVLVSHYFGEVPSGTSFACVGWVAVLMFFVLSGYLVGRLIIEKMDSGNFLSVFYLRRVCRTFPTYFVATLTVLALLAYLGDAKWLDRDAHFPAWSYLVFVQNYFAVTTDSAGVHWLSPTWTLALEEQFYLVAPFMLMLTPRRAWLPLMFGLSFLGLALRGWGILRGDLGVAPIALLPTAADVLLAGMILAVLVKDNLIDWVKYSLHIRATPILCLLATSVLQRLDGGVVGPRFEIFGPFLMSIGCAAIILSLVKNAPEAPRFENRVLIFFGRISYGVYLTHLMALGLMHGLILHAAPDIGTPLQFAVTTAALAITVAIGWAMTKVLEEPITRWGRKHRWV